MADLYLPKQSISVPKGNDGFLVFTVRNEKGELEDIEGAQEIVFAVFDKPDGTLQFQKTLTDGDITIHGNNYKFSFWVDSEDTAAIDGRIVYHECEMTNSAGRKRTVSAGPFRAENTYIRSIV
jgi:hypothetical protein